MRAVHIYEVRITGILRGKRFLECDKNTAVEFVVIVSCLICAAHSLR